ncbi:MAG: bifunctional allantoicase/(S)-ureidoglycine aminohydrolase [Pseudomonadota bacterium]
MSYANPPGGLPPQNALMTGRAVFTEAYAVLPKGTMRDITASFFPGWENARGWILARPLSGFAETFAQYAMELEPGGGSDAPEPEGNAENAIFVTEGSVEILLDRTSTTLTAGGFAYLPPRAPWSVRAGRDGARLQMIRKLYEPADGLDAPSPFFANDRELKPIEMPGTDGGWATTRFMDPADLSHDMHVTIVTLRPGYVIPFEETHVMEHGLYVLQGKGVYKLNRDWVEVEAGDFMWLRAFCPQACYAGGPEPFRYLLYKDVNRHPRLRIGST